MKQSVDWRVPLILAVPVLVFVGLGLAILQPFGSGSSPRTEHIQFGMGKDLRTPAPTPTPYPTVAPTVAPVYVPALNCSTGVTQMLAWAAVEGNALVIHVVDQSRHPVVCAVAHPLDSSRYWVGGNTGLDGTMRFALSRLPAHLNFTDIVSLPGAPDTTFTFTR